MSKLVRESVERAKKLIAKRTGLIEGSLKQEIEGRLARAEALASEIQALKSAAKEKRLDSEENARALARLTRRAKKAAEATRAIGKAESRTAKKAAAARPKRKPAARSGAAKIASEPTTRA